jgi:hypothetical protein
MTTKSKARSKSTAPVAAPVRYEDDLYGWVEDQIQLLRANEVGSIDASHITQELTDLGRSEFNKLVSTVRIILLHLMKWDHQPERRSRSWVTTIAEHRDRIEYQLRDTPSLQPRFPDVIREAYRLALRAAARETQLSAEAFPKTCPYEWEDIIRRPILWDDSNTG